ncbi:hypothetical protein WMY93_033544 [Mugilogobius chulae]|uniref:Uncharacterized protein n=1 Tax=Mugilogobius chulae TaxID=88201 RepID=A0AAW0MGU6_9GOBI
MLWQEAYMACAHFRESALSAYSCLAGWTIDSGWPDRGCQSRQTAKSGADRCMEMCRRSSGGGGAEAAINLLLRVSAQTPESSRTNPRPAASVFYTFNTFIYETPDRDVTMSHVDVKNIKPTTFEEQYFDEYEYYNLSDKYAEGSSRKGRSKKEASENTNRPNPEDTRGRSWRSWVNTEKKG